MALFRIDDVQVRDAATGELLQGLVGQPVKIVLRDTTTAHPIYNSVGDPISGSVVNVTQTFTVPRIWVDDADGALATLYLDWWDQASGARGAVDFDIPLRNSASAAAAAASASALSAAASATSAATLALPSGGQTGQSLVKASDADHDYEWATTGGPGGGVTDHGALSGLGDDDHPQYLTEARSNNLHYTKGQVDTLVNNAASQNSAADRNRANHTGTQAISTISGLQAILDGLGGTAVNSVAGKTGNVTLVAADISDSGATGRELLGATSAAAARTTLGAAATSHTHPATAISDSTSTGRGVLTAASAAAARAAIGAGTSDLALGTTGSTAMRGNAIVIDPVSTAGLPDGTLIARTS
jgi:hypothetical protein